MKKTIIVSIIILALAASVYAGPREEQYARETAMSGAEKTWADNGSEYRSFIADRDGGCTIVAVVKTQYRPGGQQLTRDVENYRVCGDAARSIGESDPYDIALPGGIDAFTDQIARQAQQQGRAEGNMQGWTVSGRARRDRDKCAVEMRLYKGGRLFGVRNVNGCQ